MFQGASKICLDLKGRFNIPKRFCDELQKELKQSLVMTKHPDGCLLVFPMSAWEIFRSKIAALPIDAHWWRRIFLGNAAEIQISSPNRILIPPELRSAAQLTCEIVLLGMGNHFEIWDTSLYSIKEAEAMKQDMPDVLKNFSF